MSRVLLPLAAATVCLLAGPATAPGATSRPPSASGTATIGAVVVDGIAASPGRSAIHDSRAASTIRVSVARRRVGHRLIVTVVPL